MKPPSRRDLQTCDLASLLNLFEDVGSTILLEMDRIGHGETSARQDIALGLRQAGRYKRGSSKREGRFRMGIIYLG